MLEIRLHKDKVGSYTEKIANNLLGKIKRVLKRQLYEDSANGMKGLSSDIRNALNKYIFTIHTKKIDVLAASRAAVSRTSTDNSTVEPYITKNSNA